MKRKLLNHIAVFITTLVVAACANAQQDRPKVEYSADQTMETADMTVNAKVYYTPNKERSETNQGGMNSVQITRHDKKVAWILMPEMKMYTEMPMGDGGAADKPGDLSGYKMEHSEVGKETLNGLTTTKSKLVMTGKDGTKFGGFMWSTKEGIMVKMDTISIADGKKMRFKRELTNLKIAKQDPQLFEIPPGYQRSDMAGLPGAGMPGADSAFAVDDDEQTSAESAGTATKAQDDKPSKRGLGLDKLKKLLRQ